jgi:hypothetical protein
MVSPPPPGYLPTEHSVIYSTSPPLDQPAPAPAPGTRPRVPAPAYPRPVSRPIPVRPAHLGPIFRYISAYSLSVARRDRAARVNAVRYLRYVLAGL